MNTPTKECSQCKKAKPLTTEYWNRAKANKDGFKGQCKQCITKYNREYRKTHKPKHNHVTWYYTPRGRLSSRQVSLNTRAKNLGLLDRIKLQDVVDLFDKYPECLCCGNSDDLEVDHIIPLSKGGPNIPDNLQILCKECNKKKDTWIIDYRPKCQSDEFRPLVKSLLSLEEYLKDELLRVYRLRQIAEQEILVAYRKT